MSNKAETPSFWMKCWGAVATTGIIAGAALAGIVAGGSPDEEVVHEPPTKPRKVVVIYN